MDPKLITWQNNVCLLDNEDRVDPFSVIEEYCDRQYLFDVRNDLTEMFRVALENRHYLYSSSLERADAFWKLLELIKVLEACYLLWGAHQEGEFKYSIQKG